MVKSELATKLGEKFPELKASDVEFALDTILTQMSDALAQGEWIEIRGLGSFNVRHHAPRLARNPKTGESVDLPAKAVVHFKPGKEMRDRVNSSNSQLAKPS